MRHGRHIISILTIISLILISGLAPAGEQTVTIPGQVDCSDGHVSDSCPGNNMGFPREPGTDTGGGGGSRNGGSTPPSQKRTAEQKAADLLKCKENFNDQSKNAYNFYTEKMRVCAAKMSNWYGNLL